MHTHSVLLDTDIGSDIDDALALAYLLRQTECELLGITTVSGEPEKRAAIADAVCQAAGKSHIPIHVGVEAPLLFPQFQPQAPQAAVLTEKDWPHQIYGKEQTALTFLQQTIHAHPGAVTLLAIGPLTNIALLFKIDPKIPALLKDLVLMGGWYFNRPQPEWNIRCDPHAAAIVFSTLRLKIHAVGIDVTQQCRRETEECRRRFSAAGGALALAADLAGQWSQHQSQITFHDPLAAAALFDPTLCGWEEHRIEVETNRGEREGQTTVKDSDLGSGTPAARLAVTVESERFFQHYFQVVGTSPA